MMVNQQAIINVNTFKVKYRFFNIGHGFLCSKDEDGSTKHTLPLLPLVIHSNNSPTMSKREKWEVNSLKTKRRENEQ